MLADTWGSRKTISLFVLIAALGSALFAVAPGFFSLAAGRFLVGLGVGFVYVPAVRVMTEWYRTDELATYSGLLLGLGSLGAVFSATPLVFMSEAVGWRGSFLAVALITLGTSALCWITVRDRPGEFGLPGIKGENGPDRAFQEQRPPVRFGKALATVLSNRHFYLLGLFLFCYYGTVLSFGSLWSGPYLQNAAGLDKAGAGTVVMMAALGLVAGCPLAGYISDRVVRSRKKVLLGGACLHLLTYLPLILWAGRLSQPALAVLFLLYGLTGGAFVINYACAKESVDPSYAGTALGAVNIFLFLGGAFFQSAMGLVIGRYPALAEGVYPVEAYRAALVFSLVCLAGATALFALFREGPARPGA